MTWMWFKNHLAKKEWRSIDFDHLKEGDYVRVNVGIESKIVEGKIVDKCLRASGSHYVWIKKDNGKLLTASKSYGRFQIRK